MLDNAINNLMVGFGEVTGLNQISFGGGSSNNGTYNRGGIVSRYASGGSVGSVPAMLTSGEYVVRKRLLIV